MERWSINEALLQSYRSTFVSSQSFLLAVGALALERRLLLSVTAAVGLTMIWLIWFPVVRSRHLLVDYYKYGVDALPDCTEDDYVHDSDKRAAANNKVGLRTNWRPTRRKLDLVLPAMFSCVWVVQFVVAIVA